MDCWQLERDKYFTFNPYPPKIILQIFLTFSSELWTNPNSEYI